MACEDTASVVGSHDVWGYRLCGRLERRFIESRVLCDTGLRSSLLAAENQLREIPQYVLYGILPPANRNPKCPLLGVG